MDGKRGVSLGRSATITSFGVVTNVTGGAPASPALWAGSLTIKVLGPDFALITSYDRCPYNGISPSFISERKHGDKGVIHFTPGV